MSHYITPGGERAIQGETKECLVCHMQIPSRAEVCPYCRYNQGYAVFWKGEGVVKALLIGVALGIGFAIIATSRVHAALGICFTDSRLPAASANEHGNRAHCANAEGRSADHSENNTKGIDDGALQ